MISRLRPKVTRSKGSSLRKFRCSSMRNEPVCLRCRCLSSEQSSGDKAPLSLREAWPMLQRRYEKLAVPVTPTGRTAADEEESEDGYRAFPLLSEESRDKMAAKSFDKRDNDKRAAVLVLLCTVNFKPSLLFMVRAGHLSQHAAQISFPGGHFEEDVDETLVDTALRETVEELVPVQQGNSQQHKHDKEAQPMLGPYRVSILGAATPLPSIRGVPVTPVVAALLDDELPDPVSTVFPGDSSEVDAIFSVSLEELLEKETSKPLPKSRFGFVDMGAPNYPSKYGDIWGLTAYIIRPLLHRLFKPVFFDKQT